MHIASHDPPPPLPTALADAAGDAERLSAQVAPLEAAIAALPAPPARSESQRRQAGDLHAQARGLRRRFAQAHAAWLYAQLTRGYRDRPRVGALLYAAADAVPGLVPSAAQIEQEREYPQRLKDGRELDQAILLSAVLGEQNAGTHLIDSMLLPTPAALAALGAFQADGHLDLGPVRLAREGRTGVLTTHNDRYLNAEDDALAMAMETAVDVALLDPAIGVCVLRGGHCTHPKYAGQRVFSPGINLKLLRDGRISFVHFLIERELGYVSKIADGLLREDGGARHEGKPWIAAVEAFAIGGGMQLALVADHVIATPDSYFCLPAAKEGLIPGTANFRLGRIAGSRMARRLVLGGRRIQATDADAGLLVDSVVPAAEMDAAIAAAARQLDSVSVVANRRMLHLAEQPVQAFREYMAEFALQQSALLYDARILHNLPH